MILIWTFKFFLVAVQRTTFKNKEFGNILDLISSTQIRLELCMFTKFVTELD